MSYLRRSSTRAVPSLHQVLLGITFALLLLSGSSLGQTPTPDGADFLILSGEQFFSGQRVLLERANDGAFLLVWPDVGISRGRGQLFESGGVEKGQDFVLTPEIGDVEFPFDVVAHPDGGFLVFRTFTANGVVGMGTGRVTSAGELIDPDRVLITDEGFLGSSGATDDDGNIVVVGFGLTTSDERAVGMRRFDARGEVIDFQILDTEGYDHTLHSTSVTGSPSGQFVVSWTQFPNGYSFNVEAEAVLFESEGPLVSHLPIDFGALRVDTNWSPAGQFVVATSDRPYGLTISARRFLPDGEFVSPVVTVAAPGYDGAGTNRSATTADPYGNFIVVWNKNLEQLVGRVFNPDLKPISRQFPVNSSAPHHKGDIRVKADEAGFFVTWTSRNPSSEPDYRAIRGRWFDTFLVFRDGFESGDSTGWDATVSPSTPEHP